MPGLSWMAPRVQTRLRFTRPEPDLLALPEVAARLRISRWQVYQLINAGALRSVQIGRRRLVARLDLEAYVERLRNRDGETAA